ncbi:MAG: hypothetical protein A2583_02895 [Bdellovibrionales bacterium RIFOXYD1_FULL_53_11]|nr:MAG: hypothetical protein A2583_02895 [Bdellovibrionales bacterium RIFOXYD1_FULL_53_11]
MKSSGIFFIIVAMSENRVIGRDGAMPWHISADFAYFKRITMGHPVVMGRKTFQSIGKPLPGRRNIVITRQASALRDVKDVVVASSFDEALALAGDGAFVIGGAEVYRQALAFAARLYITLVHAEFEGDAVFPPFNPQEFKEVSRSFNDGAPPFSFLVFERVRP